MENLNHPIYDAVLKGNLNGAIEATKNALHESADPQELISNYMSPAMEEIGRRFEEGKAFVPELLLSARAMKGSLELIKPLLQGQNSVKIGTVVIGTVKGDLHDIGKNLVASMLEGCGFDVINLGTDISSEKFINAIREHNADIVCLSALLTTTMNYMKEIIDTLEKEGIRDKVKVMVGGAPVNQRFAEDIKADGYSSNANAAVMLAKKLLAS